MPNEVQETADNAAIAAVEAANDPVPDEVALSSGIVIGFKNVPPLLLSDAVARVVKPEPPKIVHEDKGGVEEPNPNDPDYVKALELWQTASTEAASNVALMVGTYVK